ncbi:hypothetical protein Tco_1185085 [Tanacetum coccineum]
MEECYKLLTDQVDDAILRYNVSKPLPLGGLQGQVIIQSDFFFNKDLEYLKYGSKGSRPALSILKMKATYYPDVGLEQMVPDQMHTSEGDRRGVRTHMRILSVVRIEVFSLYGYDYMKKIVLRHLNHLPPKDKKILTTAVNLWTRNLVIRQRVEDFQLGIESNRRTKPHKHDGCNVAYQHDFTVIDSPRADEFGLEHTVLVNEKVDRSKEFMFAIQKRLKTRRIFHNLESFVGGRVSPQGSGEIGQPSNPTLCYDIQYTTPSPIPVKGSNSLMEEIDFFLAPDDSIPPGIENDDYDSEGGILFLEELLSNDDDIYFDIEPDTGVFTKVVDDISDNSTRELYVHVPNVLPTLLTLSPMTLTDFSESPMMIYEGNIPILDVLILPDYEASRARGFVLRSLELQSFA